MTSLLECLAQAADRPVVERCGGGHTGAMLVQRAEDLAGRVSSLDVSRVLVTLHDPADALVALAACEAAGVDLFVAHSTFTGHQIDEIVAEQAIGAVVTTGEVVEQCARTGDSPLSASPKRSVFLLTSGTTGHPKIARHTLESLSSAVRRTETSADARWLLTYPSTSFAGLQVILAAVVGGGTLITADGTSPSDFATAARHYGATHVSGTPTFWRAFLVAADAVSGLPTVRHITLGGEVADQALLDRLHNSFPFARIRHIYASTEAGVVFTVDDGREGFPSAWLDDPSRDTRLRVRDGVLEVQSGRQMVGYVSHHRSPLTEDGWIVTGDVVGIADGRVLFVGRTDCRVNVGGYKVFPEEVERVLAAVPGIADARLRSVPSALTGAVLVAEIVVAPGVDAEAARGNAASAMRANLEPYKVPRIVRIVDRIDSAVSGKKAREA